VTIFERFRAGREGPPAPVPLTPLPRPLAECRLALVVGSVCLAPAGRGVGRSVPLGHPSLREIAGDVATADLLTRAQSRADASADAGAATDARPAADANARLAAESSAANLDRNLAFGLDRLREAVAAGRLGELNRRHLALGGAMVATGRAIARVAPLAADRLVGDQVDVALLVPT
jgi:hypothetical protein